MVIERDGAGGPDRLFAIRRGLARPRFLVAVRKERCAGCGALARVVSMWVTPRGVLEEIAWCRYCFDAQCGVVKPTEDERAASEQTLRAVEARTPIVWFDCAGPVAEELERQGML